MKIYLQSTSILIISKTINFEHQFPSSTSINFNYQLTPSTFTIINFHHQLPLSSSTIFFNLQLGSSTLEIQYSFSCILSPLRHGYCTCSCKRMVYKCLPCWLLYIVMTGLRYIVLQEEELTIEKEFITARDIDCCLPLAHCHCYREDWIQEQQGDK